MSQTPAEVILGGSRLIRRATGSMRRPAAARKKSKTVRGGAGIDWTAALRSGLPSVTFENAAQHLGLSVTELSNKVGLPASTIHRKIRQGLRLSSEEGERALRAARAAAKAEELLGPENGPKWLLRPCRGLGGEVPLALLDTAIGFDEVLDELGRLEYGVIS